MIYIVPNYFIDNHYKTLSSFAHFSTLNYINKRQDSKIFARSTMHYMAVLLEGRKEIVSKGEKIGVETGEILFLSQGNYFMSERLVRNGNYRSFLIFYDDHFIARFVKRYDLTIPQEGEPIVKVKYRNETEFRSVVETMDRLISAQADEAILGLKIEEIFLYALQKDEELFLRYLCATIENAQDRIGRIIEANIDILESVEDMLSLTRVSPAHLRRYFQKNYRMSPKSWLVEQKLKRASILLKNSDKSISDIATSCGYRSISWFSQQFRERFGVTPKEYRQKSSKLLI